MNGSTTGTLGPADRVEARRRLESWRPSNPGAKPEPLARMRAELEAHLVERVRAAEQRLGL